MKFIVSILIALLPGLTSIAQRECGSVEYIKKNPVNVVPFLPTLSARDTVSNEIIIIPVVIHVLYKTAAQNISDAQVRSQLEVLNRDFSLGNTDSYKIPSAFKGVAADTRIKFCLARVDPSGHLTSGIVRKYTSISSFTGDDAVKFTNLGGDDAWNSRQYLNIWVCPLYNRSLGYATPPGSPADKDGVVINFDVFGTVGSVRSPFDKGRTATHEIGHWLGLKHIWGDEDCGSDDVDDTPTQLTFNYNCPTFPRVSACSPNSAGDMFMNFMDFTNDACMFMFTQGQKLKVRAAFANGAYRNPMLNSFACDSTRAVAGGPVPPPTPAIKPSETTAPLPVSDEIRMFPNPATNGVSITSTDKITLLGKKARVFSLTGTLLQQITLQGNTNKLDLVALKPGLYLLQVGDGDTKRIFKVVKL